MSKEFKPFKPSKKDLDERKQAGHGKVLPWPKGEGPKWEPKTVMTDQCVICGHKFVRNETVCHFCGNCQACGGYAGDIYGNWCQQCGNNTKQPRYDALGPTIHM